MDLFSFSVSAILLFIPQTRSVFRHPERAAVAKSGEFPFIAVITKRRNETVGAGNILSEFFVMTVCDKQRRSWETEWRLESNEVGYSNWRVIAGSSSNDPTGEEQGFQLRFVFYLENHPKCKVGGKYGNVYDAAVIKVTEPFVFNNLVKPIPIEKNQKTLHSKVEKMLKDGKTCTVAGWGIFMYRNGEKWEINLKGHAVAGEMSPELRKMEYKLIDFDSCSAGNGKNDSLTWVFMKPPTDKICGFGKDKKGKLCDADEGAPLVCDGQVIGFFAQSAGCGTMWWDHPTIFTRLDMGLHPWVLLYMNAKNGEVNGQSLKL